MELRKVEFRVYFKKIVGILAGILHKASSFRIPFVLLGLVVNTPKKPGAYSSDWKDPLPIIHHRRKHWIKLLVENNDELFPASF